MPLPGFQRVDHVALTVPNLDEAVAFYAKTLGFEELYRMGPFDAAEMPRSKDGRDWTAAHVNVPGARLWIAMLQMAPGVLLELFQYDLPADRITRPPRNCDAGGHHIALKVDDIDRAARWLEERGCTLMEGPVHLDQGPCAGLALRYVLDPFGNQLELVEYTQQAFMAARHQSCQGSNFK
jgi:glyoxylase I family protein